MKILLVSYDRIYSRMLSLCLDEKGAEAEIKTPEELPCPGEFNLVLLDAGAFSAAKKLPPVCVVLYGTEEQLRAVDDEACADYFILPRPFSIDELYGIIFSGRSEKAENNIPERKLGIVLDGKNRLVYIKGEKVFLSHREFDLFALLMANRGTPVSREDAAAVFLGDETDMKSNVVDVYVKYLRTKIDERFGIKLIKTVRGAGYMISM